MSEFKSAVESLLNEDHLLAKAAGIEMYLASQEYGPGVLILNTGVHPEVSRRQIYIPMDKVPILINMLQRYARYH